MPAWVPIAIELLKLIIELLKTEGIIGTHQVVKNACEARRTQREDLKRS